MQQLTNRQSFVKKWVCLKNEYQCLSGQCISRDWICDGRYILFIELIFILCFASEWNCGDGSDEQRLFILDYLNEHNSKFMNLTQLKELCHSQYRLDNTPFSDICDISFEYPCFRSGTDDPL